MNRSLTRKEAAARAEARELLPCTRRRSHLVLVEREERYTLSGAPLTTYKVVGVLRPGDEDVLEHFAKFLDPKTAGALRVAHWEDGLLDAQLLFSLGDKLLGDRL